MFKITVSGATTEELSANLSAAAAAFMGSVSAPAAAVLDPVEQARLRGSATVVPPADAKATAKGKAADDKKAKAKADAEAKAKAEAEAKAAAEAEETSTDAVDDDDVLGEGTGEVDETFTQEDVKKLLLEVRTAFPKDPSALSNVVKEYGKAAKLSDVKPEQYAAVVARCRELLAGK